MESLDKSLRRAMAHAEIPPQMQYRLMNAFAKVRQLSAEDRMADQLIMLSECLKSARSSARAPGATPAKAEVYNLYAKLLEKTRAEITSALRGTPENPEPTLQEIRKARTELNHARADRDPPLPPLGERTTLWPSWIPPHIRDKYTEALRDVQKDTKVAGKGARGRTLIPFSTLAQREALRVRWQVLAEKPQEHVKAWEAAEQALKDSDNTFTATIPRILTERRRAALEALRVIGNKTSHTASISWEDVPPVDWTHVLDPDTRARLRAEERDAGGDGHTRSPGDQAEPGPDSNGQGEAPETESLTPDGRELGTDAGRQPATGDTPEGE